jgi:hypothetical protein
MSFDRTSSRQSKGLRDGGLSGRPQRCAAGTAVLVGDRQGGGGLVVARNDRHPLYHCWRAMVRRCTDPARHEYPRYGGRGITVCARWLGAEGFRRFASDMGPKPTPKHTIDRIDNSKGYAPGNCRWATVKQQNNNTRRNRYIAHNDQVLTVTEWADLCGLKQSTLHRRLFTRGWSVERSLTTPLDSVASSSARGIRQ